MCQIIPHGMAAVFQPHVLSTYGSSNTKVVTDYIQSIGTLEIYVFLWHYFRGYSSSKQCTLALYIKKRNFLITTLSVIIMALDIVIQCINEVLSALQMGLLNRIWKHTNISYPADFLCYYIFKIITQPHHLSLSLPPSKPSSIFLLPLTQITGPCFWLLLHAYVYMPMCTYS